MLIEPARYGPRLMDLGLTSRTAAVAAASSGLGLGAAMALAAEGARVVICGRDQAKLDDALERVAAVAIGIAPVAVRCDVSNAAGGAAFIAAATDALGASPDIVVTNAGGPPPGTFTTTDVDAYPAALDLNLLSVVAMCKAAVPSMRERGWGRVVAITSLAVKQPMAQLILSNTARAGVTGFLKTMAREVAVDGVTVNSVLPGFHATPRITQLYGDGETAARAGAIPAGTIGDPADFGRVIAFLCSDHARFVTGVALPVDGGADSALL
jgi:3-oxoacyl-[acyl-carrier protein] reductase